MLEINDRQRSWCYRDDLVLVLADFGVHVEREEVVLLTCPHRWKNRGKCGVCVVTCVVTAGRWAEP